MNRPLHVLITGASSGIGEAIALAYARRGARLGLFARRAARLEAVAAQCRQLGSPEALVLLGDTTQAADVAQAFGEIRRRWPRLDRAYLNAGGLPTHLAKPDEEHPGQACCSTRRQGVEQFSAAAVRETMELNFLGAVSWLEPILAWMRSERSGTIVATGSMTSDRPLPGNGAYISSKGALHILFHALRPEAADYGIRMVLLEPGFITTELVSASPGRTYFPRTAEKAADVFVRGVEAGQSVVRYPWPMSLIGRAMSLMPQALFDRWAHAQFRPPSKSA